MGNGVHLRGRSPERAKELPHVPDEKVGLLERCEVAAAVDVRPAGDGVLSLGTASDPDVVGEHEGRGRYARVLVGLAPATSLGVADEGG